MGYTTTFEGCFTISPALPAGIVEKLNDYCNEYKSDGFPSHNCDWEFSGDGTRMCWNASEKSYSMDEWARILIKDFIPKQHSLNGVVYAQGEDTNDKWTMTAKGREIITRHAHMETDMDENLHVVMNRLQETIKTQDKRIQELESQVAALIARLDRMDDVF